MELFKSEMGYMDSKPDVFYHRERTSEPPEDNTGSPDPKRQRTVGNAKKVSVCPWEFHNNLGVPEVDLDDVQNEWDTFVGHGSNGPVRKGKWDDKDVAVKQFYVADAGERYQSEIEAYTGLKELQGKVVPRLLFVSRSWCGTVRYIGTELGQAVEANGDAELEEEVQRVHKELCARADGQLVVIDLEEFYKTGTSPSRRTQLELDSG